MKRSFLVAAVVLAVLSGCSKKQESGTLARLPPKVTIGVQVYTNPEAIAIAEGWLTELMGVEVDIVYFDAGRDVVTAMASGSIDFGQLGSPPAAIGIANGVTCQIVYIHDVAGESDSLNVRGNLGVTDAQGLTGLKIAATFSSSSHYSLLKYLEINNVNPSDVTIIDMGAGDMLGAFRRGDIDGAFVWEPHATNMRNNGGVMLTSARELADRGYATMTVEIVRTEFAEKYPDLVSAYVRTMDRAVALYRNDPKAAGAAMARQTGLTVEECLELAEGAVWLSVDEQKGMRWAGSSALANIMYSTAQFLYEQGNIPREPTIDLFQRAVTNRYLVAWEGE